MTSLTIAAALFAARITSPNDLLAVTEAMREPFAERQTLEYVVPFDADVVFVPRKEWDEVTNRVEVLWADHTNRLARAAAMKARREETLKAAKAASRKPWRAPKIPHRAPHTEARPR